MAVSERQLLMARVLKLSLRCRLGGEARSRVSRDVLVVLVMDEGLFVDE